jgi:hypothetical protein
VEALFAPRRRLPRQIDDVLLVCACMSERLRYHSDILACYIIAPRQSRHVCIDRGTVSVRGRACRRHLGTLGRPHRVTMPRGVVANFLGRAVCARVYFTAFGFLVFYLRVIK